MPRHPVLPYATSLLLASIAAAQAPVIPVVPYPRTLDLLLIDSTADGVWRLTDLNLDGDYHDAGEVGVYLTNTVNAGGVTLGVPNCIACGPDGTAYVADSSVDLVARLIDLDGDGDANDAGEANVFFHSTTNANGIVMAAAQSIAVDSLGRVFVLAANAGSPAVGTDVILRLEDLNGDGDADDANESFVFCQIPNAGGAVSHSNGTKFAIGPDFGLYYGDIGTNGPITKGIYRAFDANFDGDCNDPGEVTLFWTPAFAGNPAWYGVAFDRLGNLYVSDHGQNNWNVWKAFDGNGSGIIDPGEQSLYYNAVDPIWWDIAWRDDGRLLLCNGANPDEITALFDGNGDGDALDGGEATTAFDSATPGLPVVNLRGAAFRRAPLLELSPPLVPIGQTTDFVARAAKPGDLTIVLLSIGLIPPVPLPPWGLLEIDPTAFVILGGGLANAAAQVIVTLPVPANPALIGLSFGGQVLAGDSVRWFFSNGALLTLTP